MKRIVIIALIFLPALVFAGGKFTVQGTVGTYNAPAKVYLQFDLNGKTVTDSVKLKNGEFKFSGSVGEVPISAYLIFNASGNGPIYKDYRAIYLEQGIINVTTSDRIANAKVEGPKTNQENERYLLAYKPINDGQKAIDDQENAAGPQPGWSPEFGKQDRLDQKKLDAQEADVNKTFIRDNPDSYISLDALEMYAYGADYVDIAPLYEGLSPAIKQSPGGKKFGDRLPKLKAVAIGAIAPEFAEPDTSGKIVSLASFRGKYVLIDFWASWCGPCRHENPNVVKAYNRYKTQNFTIVGVSLDRPGNKEKWLKAIRTDGLTWTQLSDLKFWDNKAAGLYAVRGIPQNFLLDPDGKIIGKNLRGEDLEEKLAELFGKI
jgi:peroxiredoxin